MDLETIWMEIRSRLEQEKKQIYDEIINYPPPIPACDVQFNYLLEERTRITQDLRRAREMSAKSLNQRDSASLLRQFIESCTYVDASLGAKLKSDLEAVLMAEDASEKSGIR